MELAINPLDGSSDHPGIGRSGNQLDDEPRLLPRSICGSVVGQELSHRRGC
jgi:hypothetical protein